MDQQTTLRAIARGAVNFALAERNSGSFDLDKVVEVVQDFGEAFLPELPREYETGVLYAREILNEVNERISGFGTFVNLDEIDELNNLKDLRDDLESMLGLN
jgi:hypothetical protein